MALSVKRYFGKRTIGIAAAATAALALSACATPFRADVARFQSQLPAPQGQTFTIKALDPAMDGGLEFGTYANYVAAELARVGYRPAVSGQAADLVVSVGYGVDAGKEKIQSDPFYDPFYGRGYGYGAGFGRPVFVRGRHGGRYLVGWHDPFMFGGYGGFGRGGVSSYTVYTSGLDVQIARAADGQRLFEGRAEARSRDNELTHLVPNLVQAMFTNFPGNSGEKVRITIAPPPKAG